MKFAFGHALHPDRPNGLGEFIDLSRLAEEMGFAMVMMGDTPALAGEHFTSLTLIAQNTSKVRLGSFISNPLMRHPVVATGGIATVDALANGRAFFGLSSGDSGVYNLGMKPATQAQLEEYIVTMQSLFDRGEAVFEGQTVRFNWAQRRIPIYMAPGGPKGLRLAGRIADGVFIESGFQQDAIDDAYAQIAAGAAEAGRSPDNIEMWWHARACFGDDRDDAIEKIQSGILGIGNRLGRFQQEGKFIPDHIWPKLQELKRRYDFLHHEEVKGKTGELANAHLLNELGLRDYLADRFAIVGDVDQWIERIATLREMGVKNIAFTALMPDKKGFLETMGQHIVPRFS
ncbi:MAG: Methylenetetrahydromethanopterin reductase [Caulobacteraceae bacterium]|nr:Methylenetetrahydromethanopterin reductase [Caulobacteraceae bacterium]